MSRVGMGADAVRRHHQVRFAVPSEVIGNIEGRFFQVLDGFEAATDRASFQHRHIVGGFPHLSISHQFSCIDPT